MRRQYEYYNNILHYAGGVAHTHTAKSLLPAIRLLRRAVATEAVADYDVGAENNIVDDVINQFSWT